MYEAKIPKCMSTQHPDNVHTPFFSENAEIGGEDEVKEAYYGFSHLGVDEQMWDCEGKETDDFVVKKLLANYGDFFKDNKIGKDLFLTMRVPNPAIEKAEAKILIETLESIPRSFDTSKLFYEEEQSPIFEVILPMTTSADSLNRIYNYYRDFVVGKQKKSFKEEDLTIAEWIGDFKPDAINVIPLLEDKENMLAVYDITKKYLEDKDTEHQRIFLARSDPAMNYGNLSAILLNKIALQKINDLNEETSVDIYPILGAGSSPFRGNLTPFTVDRIIDDYPSVHTFTIQSAFKYDNPPKEVRDGVEYLQSRKTESPQKINIKRSLEIVERYSSEYRKHISQLVSVINDVARYVPGRRKRKLHTGLFGYSRDFEGTNLPRAITFTASLYSIGLPPEILGLNALEEKDLEYIREVYVHFDDDLKTALEYFNKDSPFVPDELRKTLIELREEVDINLEHKKVTDEIIERIRKENKVKISEFVQEAANLRSFLG